MDKFSGGQNFLIHGTISKFDPSKEDWSTWIEQLKFYFTANKVTDDDMKRSILLANVAPATFI